jgi:hypothetical protein
MRRRYFELVQMLMDRQLLDARDRACGRVDDLELQGGAGELEVTAILTGPGVAISRLPSWLEGLAARIFGRRRSRIPWSDVDTVTAQVKLAPGADTKPFERAEEGVGRWLARLPGG